MYNNFGVLLLEIGDYPAASKYFEEALESIRR
jgi:Tfp pilus assembly protein PilF